MPLILQVSTFIILITVVLCIVIDRRAYTGLGALFAQLLVIGVASLLIIGMFIVSIFQ